MKPRRRVKQFTSPPRRAVRVPQARNVPYCTFVLDDDEEHVLRKEDCDVVMRMMDDENVSDSAIYRFVRRKSVRDTRLGYPVDEDRRLSGRRITR